MHMETQINAIFWTNIPLSILQISIEKFVAAIFCIANPNWPEMFGIQDRAQYFGYVIVVANFHE